MILLALLLQVSTPDSGPDIVVRAPLPPQPQVPATMVVELNACLAKTFAAAPGVDDGAMRYIAYGDWALHWLGDRAALPSPYEVDRNADDRITLTELQDHFGRLFARFDRDGDTLVSRAELITYRATPMGGDAPPGDKPAPPARNGRQPRR